MHCWHCENAACGVCSLCGRALCKKHAKRHPHILASFDEEGDNPRVIMVDNTLWCGVCKPIPEPVPMPEIEGDD